ncbi:Hypothetical protein ORPV_313 [Orpheovirus IHUMI-LCC2]|uniref:Uncharacterized protein n=1 Tax=Orpheovirus IHUMI-LCC2 TaxID=2023057 RepID=A0A2I2L3X2_9VIRU|nr:Hypothetical protein ORPV_313 [Orpheovirus IHUMI-LCC2]SNW62217.1 Hypothetical protein ORPV_313 [Orpheovirus IHUMI-LCC2]
MEFNYTIHKNSRSLKGLKDFLRHSCNSNINISLYKDKINIIIKTEDLLKCINLYSTNKNMDEDENSNSKLVSKNVSYEELMNILNLLIKGDDVNIYGTEDTLTFSGIINGSINNYVL